LKLVMMPIHARWALVCNAPQLIEALRPLLEVRCSLGSTAFSASLHDALAHADYVLMVGGEPPAFAIVPASDGRRVPVGWIPAERDGVANFARSAAAVAARQRDGLSSGPAVLLAQCDERALALADELEPLADAHLVRWTAERIARRDLIDALRCGPAIALYLGHALSGGWVGYGGVTAAALMQRRMQPLGAVLSIACDAAQRHRGRASFSDELVLRGGCAGALGAVGKTLHQTNRVLARAIVRAMRSAATLGELVLQVPQETRIGYRIVGDPAAPLLGAPGASVRVAAVCAPAPAALMPSTLQSRQYWSEPTRSVRIG
jgi:hypothetical protein